MKSGWVDRDAKAIVADGAKAGIDPDLSLRIYTTRLLGRDPKIVLHGGGNTSLKTRMRDLLGAEVEVLRIKASGADMASIGPTGFPALRLEPMRELRALATIGDEELLGIERASLIDPGAPNPSVEVMLHAFLPHKFIDHTHATAALSVIDQPRGEQICAEVFGDRMAFVPYLMPGFGLAKKAFEVFERAPGCEGLILSKHGLVTFGETAHEAYERMIAFVSRAEDFIARNRKSVAAAQAARRPPPVAEVAPIVRGVCSEKDDKTEGAWRRLVLEFRSGSAIADFLNGKDLARLSQAGVITPDHTIRTKNWPLVLNAPEPERIGKFALDANEKAHEFTTRYRDYFARHNRRAGGTKQPLDPLPRVALVRGLGLFGLGRTKQDAVIAADIAEAWIECLADAESIGRFESISEADMFDCEYWPLEQAKLGARQELREEPALAGQVAAITGAGGAIGAAIAKA
ncbi:MAG: class II aldolase/adducin family protein, partial [Xanthobacteraceae bacterium]